MYLCFLLLSTRSPLGEEVTSANDSTTLAEIQARLGPAFPFTPQFFTDNRDIIELFLGPGKQAKRAALNEVKMLFNEAGADRELPWETPPCPRDQELDELANHILQ